MTDEMKKQQEEEIQWLEEQRFFREEEEAWLKSFPRMTDTDWIEMFPEARSVLPEKIQEWGKEKKRMMDIAKRAVRLSTPETSIEIRLTLQVKVIPRINEAEAQIRRLNCQVHYKEGVHVPGRVTEADIKRAKEVPIESLVESVARRNGKTFSMKCPLHEDRSPSFVVYRESNNCWCFGCQQGGDSIAITRLMHGLSFIEAVKYLNRV
jgi:hypothetical protein